MIVLLKSALINRELGSGPSLVRSLPPFNDIFRARSKPDFQINSELCNCVAEVIQQIVVVKDMSQHELAAAQKVKSRPVILLFCITDWTISISYIPAQGRKLLELESDPTTGSIRYTSTLPGLISANLEGGSAAMIRRCSTDSVQWTERVEGLQNVSIELLRSTEPCLAEFKDTFAQVPVSTPRIGL